MTLQLPLDTSLDDLFRHLPNRRIKWALQREGMWTLEELLEKTEYEILYIPNLNVKSLAVIKDTLGKWGLSLKPKPKEIRSSADLDWDY